MTWILLALGVAMAEPDDPFAPTYGEPVEREAMLRMDPLPQGKRFQGTWLVFDDGTRWLVAYRPLERYLPLVDKRVVAKGRPYTLPNTVQHIGATHFEIDSLTPAEGVTPRDPAPERLPAPPLARSLDDLAGHEWVQVVGTLTALDQDPENRFARVGSLALAGGETVRIAWAPAGDSSWQAHVGEQVTVLAQPAGDPPALRAHRICRGEVPRCGMEE